MTIATTIETPYFDLAGVEASPEAEAVCDYRVKSAQVELEWLGRRIWWSTARPEEAPPYLEGASNVLVHVATRAKADLYAPIAVTLRSLQALVGQRAFETARYVLSEMRDCDLVPERVVNTSEGEIAFYFRGGELLPGGAHRRYATLVCDEDGEVTALVADRLSPQWDVVWQASLESLDETFDRIAGFVEA